MESKTHYSIFTALLVVAASIPVQAQSDIKATPNVTAAPETETNYLVVHKEGDPRFFTSIERKGPCTILGPPLSTEQLRVPFQLYPKESWEKHEEGSVKIQLIFDSDWCIRKATIIESTKFWRLDDVSLKWAMTIKWTPKKTLTTPEGEPTVDFPIRWGPSQRR
jgi:hypothetical protein